MSIPPKAERLRATVSDVRARLEAQDTSLSTAELTEAVRLLTEALDQVEAESRATAQRLRWYGSELTSLEERLSRVENSFLFRLMRGIGRIFRTSKLKVGQRLLKSPLHSVYLKLAPG